jgi:hypothetical protein
MHPIAPRSPPHMPHPPPSGPSVQAPVQAHVPTSHIEAVDSSSRAVTVSPKSPENTVDLTQNTDPVAKQVTNEAEDTESPRKPTVLSKFKRLFSPKKRPTGSRQGDLRDKPTNGQARSG